MSSSNLSSIFIRQLLGGLLALVTITCFIYTYPPGETQSHDLLQAMTYPLIVLAIWVPSILVASANRQRVRTGLKDARRLTRLLVAAWLVASLYALSIYGQDIFVGLLIAVIPMTWVIIVGLRETIVFCLSLSTYLIYTLATLGSGFSGEDFSIFTLWATVSFTFVLFSREIEKRRRNLADARNSVRELNRDIRERVLKRYLPPALINDIFEGKVSMDTKPATQDITVLFSDLSGFTKMSEEQGAETVADFLNDYLTVMNETIFQNNGTIDKFIGDAIMVLFGAPVPMSAKEQAENAARCARAMQAGMVLVNEKWKARGLNEVSMKIGIHQGTAVVGNFGSAQRVDYTAIGPSVNLASRIESACVPGEIFVSPEISELLSPELTEQAGEYELKGISGKTSLYRLVGTVSSSL